MDPDLSILYYLEMLKCIYGKGGRALTQNKPWISPQWSVSDPRIYQHLKGKGTQKYTSMLEICTQEYTNLAKFRILIH